MITRLYSCLQDRILVFFQEMLAKIFLQEIIIPKYEF